MPGNPFFFKPSVIIFLVLGCFPVFAAVNDRNYRQAIERSSIHHYSKSHQSLATLDNNQERLVVFTNFNGFKTTDTQLGDTIWTAVEAELKPLCQQYVARKHPSHKQLTLWIGQLLGLPPYQLETRRFVILDVPTIQAFYGNVPSSIGVFRPCTDPRISSHADGSAPCPAQIDVNDPNIASDFKTWFINNTINYHTLKRDPNTHQYLGYPWTGYGFTYNWNPMTNNPRGVSEFVVLKNTPITVLANPGNSASAYLSPEQYCRN